MESFEDDNLLSESELDRIWMGGKNDISSCAEILSSRSELLSSPSIPNLWVDSTQEYKPDSMAALLKDDAESQQDILKNVSESMDSPCMIMDEEVETKMDMEETADSGSESLNNKLKPIQPDESYTMDINTETILDTEGSSAVEGENQGIKENTIVEPMESEDSNLKSEAAIAVENIPLSIVSEGDKDIESKGGGKSQEDEIPNIMKKAQVIEESESIAAIENIPKGSVIIDETEDLLDVSQPSKDKLSEPASKIRSLQTPEMLMTSQDIMDDSPTPTTVPIITLGDSINTSPEISFMSETSAVKDNRHVMPKQDDAVTLQLSPSQMTQSQMTLKDIVPETPSKGLHGLDDTPSLIEIASFSLDTLDENKLSEPQVNEAIGKPKEHVAESKPSEGKEISKNTADKTDIDAIIQSVIGSKSDEVDSESKSETVCLNDSKVINMKTCDTEIVDRGSSDDPSDKSNSDNGAKILFDKSSESTDSVKPSKDQPMPMKAVLSTSSSGTSGLYLSDITPDSAHLQKVNIAFSQEDRKSAEIAMKNLKEHKSSTPIDSLESTISSSSLDSSSSSCRVKDYIVVTKKVGIVTEMLKFDVKNGEPVNVKQLLVTTTVPFDLKNIKKVTCTKCEAEGLLLHQFIVNANNNTSECRHNGFCLMFGSRKSEARVNHSDSEIFCSYLMHAKQVTKLYTKDEKMIGQEISCYEDVTPGNVDPSFPVIIWNEPGEDIYERAAKCISQSNMRNGTKEVIGKKFFVKWRFYLKSKKLDKVDRVLVPQSAIESSGYLADVSSTSSGKSSLESKSSLDISSYEISLHRRVSSGSSKTSSSSDNTPKDSQLFTRPSTSLNRRKSGTKSSQVEKFHEVEPEDILIERSPPEVHRPPGRIKLGSVVLARFSDGIYYPAKVKSLDEKNRYKVVFLDDKIVKSVLEKEIINTKWLPLGQSVMARSVDHFVTSGIIEKYFETKKDEGYVINRDDGLKANFSIIDVTLSSSQAQILEEDLYGQSRAPANVASPISADLNLVNIVHGKRKAAHAAPSVTPKSSRKKPKCPDANLESSLSSSTSSGTNAPNNRAKRRKAKDDTYDAQVEEKLGKSSKKQLFDSDDRKIAADSPRSRTRKGVISSNEASDGQLFQGLAFILTNRALDKECEESDDGAVAREDANFDKSILRNSIIKEGGVLLSSFDDIQKSNKTCYLLASSYLRTIKYIQCVSAGITCLSHLFILESISEKKLKSIKNYFLPAGFSLIKNSVIPWHGKKLQMPNWTVMIQGKKSFLDQWSGILESAGAEVAIANPRDIEVDHFVGVRVIMSEPKCPQKVLEMVQLLELSIVSSEWLIQSVIMGEVQQFNGHPEFSLTSS